jgi:hypothetical protein
MFVKKAIICENSDKYFERYTIYIYHKDKQKMENKADRNISGNEPKIKRRFATIFTEIFKFSLINIFKLS